LEQQNLNFSITAMRRAHLTHVSNNVVAYQTRQRYGAGGDQPTVTDVNHLHRG